MKNLGKYGKDKITGFEGIITGKCYYLFGCAQYCLAPKVGEDGKRPNVEWFDSGRIEIIYGKGINMKDVQIENDPGCETQEHPDKS